MSVSLETGAMIYLSKLRPSKERPIEEKGKQIILKKWLEMEEEEKRVAELGESLARYK